MKVLYPWKMIGRYADDEEIEVGGFDEEDCMTRLISKIEKHGDRKSTRLNSSHMPKSRMPSSA